ncbi:MAG: hypothetical protein H2057_04840 [Alphaproteobacteria bacterium]|nr:hypothetical protein [Alphaproteobacteria bacterium]
MIVLSEKGGFAFTVYLPESALTHLLALDDAANLQTKIKAARDQEGPLRTYPAYPKTVVQKLGIANALTNWNICVRYQRKRHGLQVSKAWDFS